MSDDDDIPLPSREMVLKYKLLAPLLGSALREVRELSKKKQDALMSAFKVRKINRILSDIRDLIKGDASNAYLDMLDDATLPQNSDAVLIMSEYEVALERFKSRFFVEEDSLDFEDYWMTRDGNFTDDEIDGKVREEATEDDEDSSDEDSNDEDNEADESSEES